ncbi:hypothetical protein IC582_011760 [Cucumis melo]
MNAVGVIPITLSVTNIPITNPTPPLSLPLHLLRSQQIFNGERCEILPWNNLKGKKKK